MRKISSPQQLAKVLTRLRKKGKTLGFVPTMGALHEGHLSLVRAARRENKMVVVSIFVNPTQFGPKEDLKKYPRPLTHDLRLLKKEKVDFVFVPTVKAIYGKKVKASVKPNVKLTKTLCGKSRPGHFQGVATVVAKLFEIVNPNRVYFGAKDYQQGMVIKRLIEDLDFKIRFRLMPIVREKDGLAMSSRNQYLSPVQRQQALALSKTLFELRRGVRARKGSLKALRQAGLKRLRTKGIRVDYLELVDPESLQKLRRKQPKMLAAVAGFVGKTRLIDNVIIRA